MMSTVGLEGNERGNKETDGTLAHDTRRRPTFEILSSDLAYGI